MPSFFRKICQSFAILITTKKKKKLTCAKQLTNHNIFTCQAVVYEIFACSTNKVDVLGVIADLEHCVHSVHSVRLGHLSSPHASVASDCPWQRCLLLAKHSLAFLLVPPPPQLTEQSVHSVHSVQLEQGCSLQGSVVTRSDRQRLPNSSLKLMHSRTRLLRFIYGKTKNLICCCILELPTLRSTETT